MRHAAGLPTTSDEEPFVWYVEHDDFYGEVSLKVRRGQDFDGSYYVLSVQEDGALIRHEGIPASFGLPVDLDGRVRIT